MTLISPSVIKAPVHACCLPQVGECFLQGSDYLTTCLFRLASCHVWVKTAVHQCHSGQTISPGCCWKLNYPLLLNPPQRCMHLKRRHSMIPVAQYTRLLRNRDAQGWVQIPLITLHPGLSCKPVLCWPSRTLKAPLIRYVWHTSAWNKPAMRP
jgi:hypothetical protein